MDFVQEKIWTRWITEVPVAAGVNVPIIWDQTKKEEKKKGFFVAFLSGLLVFIYWKKLSDPFLRVCSLFTKKLQNDDIKWVHIDLYSHVMPRADIKMSFCNKNDIVFVSFGGNVDIYIWRTLKTLHWKTIICV